MVDARRQAETRAGTGRRRRGPLGFLSHLLLRSFFPVAALVLIAGVAVWGPWVSLAVVAVLWNVVMRTV